MEPKVLVIEDDVEINELLGEYLGLEGIRYISAFDGQSGLDKAPAAQPDALVLDLMLPDIDGYEVCKRLTNRRPTATTPIIILTCMNQECDREKGLAMGAFRFMNKPFLPDDLIAQLREAFDWRASLPTRQSKGTIEISAENASATYIGINDMVTRLFAHSPLPDGAIAHIREGFHSLLQWASDWHRQHGQDPKLKVAWQLTSAAGQPPVNGQAERVQWTLSEPEAGLLYESLFRTTPAAAPAPLTVPPSATTTLATHLNQLNPFNLFRGSGATATATVPATGNGAAAEHTDAASACALGSPNLTLWYQFLARCGVGRFEKDSRLGEVRLIRDLNPTAPEDTPVPVVTIDGARMPTRLRSEALASKRK